MKHERKYFFIPVILFFQNIAIANDDSCSSFEWWTELARNNLPLILIVVIWYFSYIQYRNHRENTKSYKISMERATLHMEKVEKLLGEIIESNKVKKSGDE